MPARSLDRAIGTGVVQSMIAPCSRLVPTALALERVTAAGLNGVP
jgi:hypothetical protein